MLDSSRFGRTPLLFLLALAACCLVAIIALAIVVSQRGPAGTIVGLLLALLPIPLLVALILYLDRLEPEPRALLAAIFGAGAGIAVITALLGRALHTGVITTPELDPKASVTATVSAGAALGGALLAQTMLGLVLLALLASRRTEIDGVEDGVVYGSMVGLGVSYAAARPAVPGRYLAVFAGWVAAVGLDALWNHSSGEAGTGLQVTYLILAVALLAVVITVLADRRRVIGMITSFLPDFQDPEVVTPQDIRMLASPRLRRLGRHWARLELGIAGKQAMTQYQLAASELAVACRRKTLGQTTEDIYVRHRDDSLSLMRAAAAIVRRQEQLSPPPWIDPDYPSVFVPQGPIPPPSPPRWPSPSL